MIPELLAAAALALGQPVPTPTPEPPTPIVTVEAAITRQPLYVPLPYFVSEAIAQGWEVTPHLIEVALCESGADIDHDGVLDSVNLWATGAAGERGPMQLHPVHADALVADEGYEWGDMYRLGPNLAVAHALYELAGGFGPWSCSR